MRSIYKRCLILLAALLILLTAASCGRTGGDVPTDEKEGGSDVCVIFMSDTQSDPDGIYDYGSFSALLQSAFDVTGGAKRLIVGGDIVNNETDTGEWEAFRKAGGGLMAGMTVYPVIGNHTAHTEYYPDFLSVSDNSPAGYEKRFYSFDVGNAHFIILDSMTMGSLEESVADEIAEWISGDLKSSGAKWKIAVMHHPIFPITDSYKDSVRAETMRANYYDILEENGVMAVLCGHQHMYCRARVTGDGASGEITQIMCVSGGKMYNTSPVVEVEKVFNEEPVYTVVAETADGLSIKTYTAESAPVDEFVLRGQTVIAK